MLVALENHGYDEEEFFSGEDQELEFATSQKFHSYLFGDMSVLYELSSVIPQDKLDNFYGYFDDDSENDYEWSYERYLLMSGIKYYFVNPESKNVYTNLSEEEVKAKVYKDFVKSNDNYAFQSVNGEFVQSPRMKLDHDPSGCDPETEYEVYARIDFTEESKYKVLNEYFAGISINYLKTAVFAAIELSAAIALMIVSLVICGKRDRNGVVKRAFIDYVPTDVHLAATAGLIVLVTIMPVGFMFDSIYSIYDKIYYAINLVQPAIAACCALAWALLIEFLTSLVRVCKSKKKLYDNFFIVMIIKSFFKLAKKGVHLAAEPFKFKPNNFKKPVIRLVIGYSVINVVLLISLLTLISFGNFYDDEIVMCWILEIVIFALNTVSAVFVFRYIVMLDTIITCAQNRTPVPLDYNKLPRSLKVLCDSLRYTNLELDRAVSKAVKDERLRTELITNVSHDLKTPLTSIINYVDLLKGCDIQDENAKEYIGVLDEKGIKLKRLIEDLIEASKVTSGVIKLNPVNLNLNELATQAVVEHQQEFIDNGLELVFKGDSASNVVAFADGNKTFRIIENLLSNARKYSARGSRVYSDVYEANNACVFEIKNISAEPLDISPEELTERFVRGDKSRTNEGNGLGLSIAQNLCTAQSGRLEISIDGDLFKAKVVLPKQKI